MKDYILLPERNRKTKHLISFSLFRLLLKKPYHEVSIIEICAIAGVSRTTFYRHFQDKLDIILEFTDEKFEEFYDYIGKAYKTINIKDLIFEIFNIVYRYRLQVVKLMEADLQNLLLNQLVYYFRYLFRQSHFKSESVNLADINSPHFVYGASLCAGAMYSCILRWAESNMEETPESLTKCILELIELISGLSDGRDISVSTFINRNK